MSDTPVLTRPKPKGRRFHIDPAKRRRIEAAIEAMITALDTIDDPDEDSQADDDPIDGDELEGPIDDDEPSLGATEHINQSIAWRAPDGVFFSDSEIGLGWPPNGSRPGHQGSARPGWTLTSGSVRGGILLPCGPPTC